MVCDILITHIKGLVQVRDQPITQVRGKEMAYLPVLSEAFLVITDGKIKAYGTMQNLASEISAKITFNAQGRFVFPAFVDSHTHLVFAASREEEFVMKLKGATYEEIAANGGGILNSARKLQQLTEDELLECSLPRAWEVIRTGTGAIEIKSGYGLTTRDELKMLRVAKRIGKETPLLVKTTFLGAHAVPKGKSKDQYISEVINEMIPTVANERLAEYIDVFCEHGFFSPSETEQIVAAGLRFGLRPRIHANQLARSGGVQVGVKLGAISVDHLEQIGDEEVESLKSGDTMPVSLPGAAFFLNLPFTPARTLIDNGLPVAIASDYNPGSAPSGNMPFMVSLACIKMRMTPEEAINATTINTAYTLGLENVCGSISVGKMANLFITHPMSSVASIPYHFGSNPVAEVILNGKFIPKREAW